MRLNQNSGYGLAVNTRFTPRSLGGRTLIVGNTTLNRYDNIQDTFPVDVFGVARVHSTIAAALVDAHQYKFISVTGDATADTLTSTTAHGLQNGQKVVLGGTTAPSGTTLGTVYYVVGATSTTFQVSASRGGTAIDLSSTGTTVTACAFSSVGDTIYVLPGHSENISSSTALNLNVAGVSLVGLGEGENRPTLYIDTATTALLTVSAPLVTIEGFIIDATGFDAIATAVSVTADDATFRNCKFNLANASAQATVGITTTALANRLSIVGCYFVGTSDAGTATAVKIVGGDSHIIKDNIFIGAYTTSLGAVQNVTTACTNTVIQDNFVNNITASSTVAFTMVSTSTGVIRRNHMQILSGTAPVVAAAMSWVGQNYYAATIGQIGILV